MTGVNFARLVLAVTSRAFYLAFVFRFANVTKVPVYIDPVTSRSEPDMRWIKILTVNQYADTVPSTVTSRHCNLILKTWEKRIRKRCQFSATFCHDFE